MTILLADQFINGEAEDDFINDNAGNDVLRGMDGGAGLDALVDHTPSEGDTRDASSP